MPIRPRLFAALLAAFATPASAHVYCVNNSIGLAAALLDAQSNGEPDIVQLQEGTIHVDSNFNASYSSSENKNLFLVGGYGPACNTLPASGAKTIIDGDGLGPLAYLSMYGASTARIQLQRIVWQNGVANANQSAVEIVTTGALGIGQNAFLHLTGSTERPEAIHLDVDGAFDVQNSVFARNITGPTSNARAITMTGGATTPHLTGNTFTGNHGLNGITVTLYLQGASGWSVANNIVYGNFTGYALQVGDNAELRYNDVDLLTGTPALNEGMLSIDPGFIDPALDYRLRADSALVNAGINGPPGGTGSYDFDDLERIVDGIADIGAYELQEIIFADGFD